MHHELQPAGEEDVDRVAGMKARAREEIVADDARIGFVQAPAPPRRTYR